MSWSALFERAAAFDVSVEAVVAGLAEWRRERSGANDADRPRGPDGAR